MTLDDLRFHAQRATGFNSTVKGVHEILNHLKSYYLIIKSYKKRGE
jgi:hypothetical protein